MIEAREGIVLHVYRDSRGLPTCGCGHLIVAADGLKVGDKITQEQCDAFLRQDLAITEHAIDTLVTVPLSQNQKDSLCSFIFNIGMGGFKKSTVLRRLNAKDYNGAAQAMMMWVKPPEITGRRRTEVKQFLTPDV